ncbi:MAG TPA: AI-2E family transporter [candidate division Zixibacteria bacterium]|nr:AI-2E family transporter [candidate division Zixibacteria bacterium]
MPENELANSQTLAEAEPTAPVPVVQVGTQPEGERRRLARTQAFALAILATGAVLTLMYVARPVLIVVACATLLAFVLAPIVSILERIHIPKSLGAFVAVILMLAALYSVFMVTYTQVNDFLNELPRYSGEIRSELMHFRRSAEKLRKTTEGVLPSTPEDRKTVVVRQSDDWADTLTRNAFSLTETLALASFVPFLAYFMLSWQDHVRTATVMLFKIENRNTAYVTLGLISAMVRSFIVGNLIIGIFLSIASMIVFASLEVPYFYVLGFISGFVSLIPYLGVVLAFIPPVVAGLGHIHGQQFVIIILAMLGLHLFALNVLYPALIGRRMQLNPLVVTLSLLMWGWLWGAMGLILAVPITAALKIVLDHVEPLRNYGAWLGENVNNE